MEEGQLHDACGADGGRAGERTYSPPWPAAATAATAGVAGTWEAAIVFRDVYVALE